MIPKINRKLSTGAIYLKSSCRRDLNLVRFEQSTMSATKLKAKIIEQDNAISNLNTEIQSIKVALENEKRDKQILIEQKEKEWEEKDSVKTKEHKAKLDELSQVIEGLKNEVRQKQEQLDKKELKKLAQAFSEQEGLYEQDQKKWLGAVIISGLLLLISAIVSVFATTGMRLEDKIGFYAIDLILISAVWFCVSQFSESTKLKHDYGNRKTLAQSFHNILSNLSEDESIRSKFIEKTTDILCAPVGRSGKEPILTKKVLKDVAEVIGASVKH